MTRTPASLAAPMCALILAVGSVLAIPQSAPAGGSDLGYPWGLKLLDATTCGQYATTPAQVSECDQNGPTWSNHWLVFGWTFSPACETAPCKSPDGFKVVRSLNGSTTVFDTVPAKPGETTFFDVLHYTGQENIGACFFVQPYRGATDLGRRSGQICITMTQTLILPPARWGNTHYYAADNGSGCSSPSSNPAGYTMMFKEGADGGNELFAGYVTRSGSISGLGVIGAEFSGDLFATAYEGGEYGGGGTGTCNYYRDIFQGMVYFDLSKLQGHYVKSATLHLEAVRGAWNAGDPNGGDGTEHAGAVNCVTSLGFPTHVNAGTGFFAGVDEPIAFDRAYTLNSGAANIDVDITGMVQDWLKPGAINRGIVLSPSYLNPTTPVAHAGSAIYNADCLSQYREPTLEVKM